MADTKAQQPERRDVDIAGDGDIILALPKNLYLRVSSTVLSLVSPVFKAMLGPRFREGNEPRSSVHPIEISLPEDDGIAMKHLCLLLHGRTGDSYSHGDRTFSTQIRALAILADKYDCVEAVALQAEAMLSRFWMHRANKQLVIQQMACLITAAVTLGLGPLFHVFTKSLVLDHCLPYSVANTGLTPSTLLQLEQQRSTARLKVHEEMIRMSPNAAYCKICCRHDVPLQNVPAVSHALSQKLGPTTWPPDFSTTTLRKTLSRILSAPDISFDTKAPCGHSVKAMIKSTKVSAKAIEIYEAVGLCLPCTKNGGKITNNCNHEENKTLAGALSVT
ncbi:hypothetical protein KC343_g16520 [Hortaea werneckii]|uniref:BTB domain-containing protein n=1 Tax=Hortaea werneckii TaxID=91943 RepID=A0A3M7HLF6_HORWE|nr:hypothetical protein KC323_g1529 [Hortaea werneckii]KAI7131211.1 hypothetical protein KC352_g31223 [Hortaea werneckii]KAI7547057.1 hypothetical protein KC317_g15231 [Hortaea werneckii]KAI7596596.1 hypothetical protein KC346_g15071 [Hortaea werneckii]KAI7598113.1 hypothetical protein KC343_g16520 [Hortaea werneckii]